MFQRPVEANSTKRAALSNLQSARKWHRITEIQKVNEESVHHLSVYPVRKNAPLPLALAQANDRTLATLLTHGRPWNTMVRLHGEPAQCGSTDVTHVTYRMKQWLIVNCCASNYLSSEEIESIVFLAIWGEEARFGSNHSNRSIIPKAAINMQKI